MAEKRTSPEGPDNFDIALVSGITGYVSSLDPTMADARLLVRGSQNVYKKISGTIANRPGRKLYDAGQDTTVAKVNTGFVWNTSLGATIPIRVANVKLQFESAISGSRVWYDLLTSLTLTRFIFDTYWDNTDKKDKLLMVNGDVAKMYDWAGGIAKFVSANIIAGAISSMVIDSAGSNYHVGDTLSITGGGGTSGSATVNTVDSSGAITSITLLAGGSGYSTTVGASTSGGTGSGATISITVTTGQIVLDRSAATSGFASSGSVSINGHTYTYTGISGSTLTGVGSDASAEPVNSVVFSKIITVNSFTSGPASPYTCDFIKVVDNQLYLGSYISQLVYLSKNNSYTDFSSNTPRLPGDGDAILLDAPGKGIGVSAGSAHIFYGTSHLAKITFNQITVGSTLSEQTIITKVPLGESTAAQGHEFIDSLADNIIYLDQANQLRSFGNFRNLFVAKAVLLSQQVQTELAEEDFTLGMLKVITDTRGDLIYIVAPNSAKTYIYQERTSLDSVGNVVAERLWQPPHLWAITGITAIAGRPVGFSSANPQFYYLWDTGQYYDDSPSGQLQYVSAAIISYQNGGRRQGKLVLDKVYWEGYMTQNSHVFGAVYLDYQGASGVRMPTINDTNELLNTNKQVFSGVIPPSLGDASLGDNPLGDGLNTQPDDQSLVPKFRVITGIQRSECFEYALMIYSNNAGARWELLALGTNQSLSFAQGVELVK